MMTYHRAEKGISMTIFAIVTNKNKKFRNLYISKMLSNGTFSLIYDMGEVLTIDVYKMDP